MFCLMELRATAKMRMTLGQALRSIRAGLQIFEHLGIDIDDRMSKGKLLDLGEVNQLCTFATWLQSDLDLLSSPQTGSPAHARVVSLERARMRSDRRSPSKRISRDSASIRLLYIRNFLLWRVQRRLLRLEVGHALYAPLLTNAETALRALNEHVKKHDPDPKTLPQGMEPGDIDTMKEVVEPDSPANPWKGRHSRYRNRLIIRLLLGLGVRKSELLGIKLTDINLRTNEVMIVRRADDPDEPRADPPEVKTKSRLLKLGDELAAMLHEYISRYRNRVRSVGRRSNGYLLVANGTGKPLSKSGMNNVFVELRTKVPSVPDELTPHVLRHSWNDEFSELMDRNKVPASEEEQIRRQQMGWSDRSRMAAVYTRRHTKKKSDQASLELQDKQFNRNKK